MTISQRGSSFTNITGTSGDTYTLDRFKIQMNSLGQAVVTVSQDSSAPDGFANSLKWATGTAESSIATTEYYTIMQKIEAQNLQTLKYGTSCLLYTSDAADE